MRAMAITELALVLALAMGAGFAPEPYRWLGTVAFRSGASAGVVAGLTMRASLAPPVPIEQPKAAPPPEKAPRAPKK